MDSKTRRALRQIVEADDGTFVDGDDVAVNRDANDPRVANLGATLIELGAKLKAARRAILYFKKTSEILVLLPESDPRHLGGLLAEIDIDVDVIAQASERLEVRLKAALDLVGPVDTKKPTDWV